MRNLFFVIKTWLTTGSENQSFIGARWLVWLLRVTPMRWRRGVALRVLAVSPHYFYPDLTEDYARLNRNQLLEAECTRNRESRRRLRDEILSQHLDLSLTVLDYGCGPGFLAHAVSENAKQVYAVDISRGVLACAQAINNAPNLTYLHTEQLGELGDQSIDLVYSFAVIQHITDDVFADMLTTLARALTPGGKLVAHVVLEPEGWRDQQSWEDDKSLTGRVKLKYGLNCFSRRPEQILTLVKQSGFENAEITPVSDRCPEHFDDICEQHLLIANLPES